MEPRVTDVELVKKRVRKLAAGQVLAGGQADVRLGLGELQGCQVRIAAGYGAPATQPSAVDRFIWVLDGSLEVRGAGGVPAEVRQGECAVLPAGQPADLVFSSLTIYLLVSAEAPS